MWVVVALFFNVTLVFYFIAFFFIYLFIFLLKMPKTKSVEHRLGRRIRPLLSKPCAVCASFIQCNNFGVPSCQACTDFFRRSVRETRNYICRYQQQCQIDAKCRVKCRSCRYKKCLQVGMKKESIKMKKIEQKLRDDEAKLQMAEKSPSSQLIRSQEVIDFNQISFLLKIEENLSRIRCSRTDLSEEYMSQFSSLDHLINCSEILLARADQFSTLPPVPWEGEKIKEFIQNFGLFAYKPYHRILDHLLSAALIKSLPGTASLCPEDKANFFRGIAVPICCFTSAYYSIRQQSDTVIKPNGLMPIWCLNVPRYVFDQNVKIMITNLYCNALKPFQQLKLTREEFVLLLAILLTQSTFATNQLSRFAHEQLYEECAIYSAILVRHVLRTHRTFELLVVITLKRWCQQRAVLPFEEGLRRFDDLLRLVSHVVWMNDYYRKFATYMDVFHFRGERKAAMPKAIYPIYSNK